MRVLVVGGGGREHALVWGLARSPRVDDIVAAPGNAGIARLARCVPDLQADDVDGVTALADRAKVDLVVIGPEAPLVAGLGDVVHARGIAVFGPGAGAARLEGSKAFAKGLMLRHGILTARAATFTSSGDAVAFVDDLGGRAVVKADGLAAGKGVTVATERAAAVAAIEDCLLRGTFGEAGRTVLVEELLEGPEVSAFALVDAGSVMPLALSQDFKRAADGDAGPNTGGMGAYSPLPFVDKDTEERIWTELVEATVRALRAERIAYRGLLYTGLMLTGDGPKVLEYNCRFGDPETQAVIPRLRTDLADLLDACARDRLEEIAVELADDAAVTVVLASGGYPGEYRTGFPIGGLDAADRVEGVTVFHSGTAERDGRVVTAGGRVLAVTALGATIAQARARAYEACSRISFEGMQRRTDIAARAAECAVEGGKR